MGITLREWSQQWLEVYVKPVAKPSGYEHYYDNLQKHILPKLGDMPLKSLTAAVVQHFLNEESLHGNLRTGGALSAKSIKNMRVVLDVCCKRAVADGMMPANPVAATVYTHCRSKKHNVMSDSDQKVLEKWLFSDLSLNNAGIILALYSGMRLGEVCAARWGNYDAMSGTLHITQTVRRVMVDPTAEYGKRTELIFSSAKSDASERDLYLPEVLQGLLTVQYQRFESLFKRTPNADDFIIYNTVGGVMDPDHLSSYWMVLACRTFVFTTFGTRLPPVRSSRVSMLQRFRAYLVMQILQRLRIITSIPAMRLCGVPWRESHRSEQLRTDGRIRACLHRKVWKRKYLKPQSVCTVAASTSQNVDE